MEFYDVEMYEQMCHEDEFVDEDKEKIHEILCEDDIHY